MKEGFKNYIDIRISDLRTKKESRDMIKNWEETVEYIKAEIEKIIGDLSGR